MSKKPAPRDTAKYIGRKGRKSVKAGVTGRPLDEREAEVRSEPGNSNVKLT